MTDRRELLRRGLFALGALPALPQAAAAAQAGGDGSFVSVRTFGARGDGETNDAPALQRAVASGASVIYLPPGAYRLDEPLDLTERGQRPLTLLGAGQSQNATPQTATLIGNTGSVVIDTVGSSYLSLSGFRIHVPGDARRPAAVGILMGRSRANPFPQFHRYDDLVVFVDSRPRATERGTVGIYNVACEHWLATQVRCFADLPFALAARDVLDVASPHTGELAPPASMTMCGLHQTTAGAFRHAGYEFWHAQNIRLDQVYAQRHPGNTSGYPLRFHTHDIAAIAVTGQFEEWPGLADFAASASGIDLDCLLNQATGPYVRLARGTSLSLSSVRVKQVHGTQQSLFAAGSGTELRASQLRLYPGQQLDAPSLTLKACTVQSLGAGPITARADGGTIFLDERGASRTP